MHDINNYKYIINKYTLLCKKLSFKISWLDEEQKFLVKQMNDNVVEEERKFDYHLDAMEYISDTMAMCLTCQEDWLFTY